MLDGMGKTTTSSRPVIGVLYGPEHINDGQMRVLYEPEALAMDNSETGERRVETP